MIEKLQKLPQAVEHRFWNFVINLLDSEDESVEALVNFGYQFSQNVQGKNFVFQAIFWICMGTIIGLALGIILI